MIMFFAGPMYQASRAWFCHVLRAFGSNRMSALVPTGANGVLLKLNCPSNTAYAESLGLTCETRSKFKVSCPCSINWHQSWIGQVGSRVPMPDSQCSFHVCIAHSAALTL